MLTWFDKAGLACQVIDACNLLLLRPDNHKDPDRDCLHNCVPGEPDVCTELLLHCLQLSFDVGEGGGKRKQNDARLKEPEKVGVCWPLVFLKMMTARQVAKAVSCIANPTAPPRR